MRKPALTREQLEKLVFGDAERQRYTQDSPVMPDVWFGYGADPHAPLDLLLEPHRGVSPGDLAKVLRERLTDGDGAAREGIEIAFDEAHVVARLRLDELVRAALPLSRWWQREIKGIDKLTDEQFGGLVGDGPIPGGFSPAARWLARLVSTLLSPDAARRPVGRPRKRTAFPAAEPDSIAALRGLAYADRAPMLWSVNRNRPARIAVFESRRTTKADAAERIFAIDTSAIAWAILDTGIDARHVAFRRRDERGRRVELGEGSFADDTRVVASWDFTRVRRLLQSGDLPGDQRPDDFRRRLLAGQAIDWEALAPLLQIEHGPDYEAQAPRHPHGTHVAGILGADWRRSDEGYEADDENDLRGMCPNIHLYDIRILDHEGNGDEFGILAALQFVRSLNQRGPQALIHGVNLSFSIPHDVSNYACGRTPVCAEAERLQASGVVVVAAAGNHGHVQYLTREGAADAYRSISITDPGNAERIITVGATHGRRPHAYGVSYFSSRGPTGDGRRKPDLVAPGEKIKSLAPDDGYASLDGTSMAAPHVSGAAAILLSRYRELIGESDRVKAILCGTATDLGRERHFQGAGLVDVLRALQSV